MQDFMIEVGSPVRIKLTDNEYNESVVLIVLKNENGHGFNITVNGKSDHVRFYGCVI